MKKPKAQTKTNHAIAIVLNLSIVLVISAFLALGLAYLSFQTSPSFVAMVHKLNFSAQFLPMAGPEPYGLPDLTGKGAGLSSDADISGDPGILGIAAIALWAYNILRVVLGAFVILLGAVAAFRMIRSRGNASEAEKSKKWLMYSVAGMVLFSLSFPLKDIFLLGGTSFFADGNNVSTTAGQLTIIIESVLRFLTYLLGGVAVLMIVVNGFSMVAFANSEENAAKHKKYFSIGLGGLVLFMLSKELVGTFYGTYNEASGAGEVSPDVELGRASFTALADFLLYFVGTLAMIAFVVAAVFYLTSATNEGNKKKAKEIAISAIIGVVLAYCSYTIVTELVLATGG